MNEVQKGTQKGFQRKEVLYGFERKRGNINILNFN